MPAPSDILQFMRGQLLQKLSLPTVDLTGRTVIITGANSGLGYECAKQLVDLNVSTLILGCRSTAQGERAKREVARKGSATDIQVWKVDLANFMSVKSFATRIENELPRLDALLANAGISMNEYHLAEGYEQTLTVNVVSTFLLGLLCLPKLQRTAEQTGTPTHLTITGSNVHAFANPQAIVEPAPGKVFTTLSDQKQADMEGRYFLSKLIVMLCVREMSKRVSRSSVIVNCPSPGWCKTPLFRQDDGGLIGRNMLKIIGRSAEIGARTLSSAIVAETDTHGQYISECQVKKTSVWVQSEEGQATQPRVWKEFLEICKGISPGVDKFLDD